jgi:nucleotide-binding universal stress UspA family protein
MKFKDILIHIDSSQQCATRLELAISLAREHEAHLTGIYIITHYPYASQSASMEAELAQAQQLFLLKTAEAEISATWLPVDWATVGVDMVEVLNYYANTKDLIIVGQGGPGMDLAGVPSDLPGRVVAGSGRPVLVVPFAGKFNSVGERVVVAWKRGRASARAVNDAMPFLLNAKEVFALSIKTPNEQHKAEIDTDSGIIANLERHNIKVKEITVVMESIPVAKILMDFAWENACDLVVLGVYASKSKGKKGLGPVAEVFFDTMTLPVLMSY